VSDEGTHVVGRYRGRTYSFPRADMPLRPISNTTAKMVSQGIGGQRVNALCEQAASGWATLAMEVKENFGQSAFSRSELNH